MKSRSCNDLVNSVQVSNAATVTPRCMLQQQQQQQQQSHLTWSLTVSRIYRPRC